MKTLFLTVFSLLVLTLNSQESLNDVLQKYNKNASSYITIDELKNNRSEFILLDARELEEYNTSHLKDAVFVGYDKFNKKKILKQLKDKNAPIVVYCSIGVRSENITKKLLKAGYTNVKNLYGGIFEWKNQGNKVFDNTNNETENVHAFSEEWSKWLKKGTKIYSKNER